MTTSTAFVPLPVRPDRSAPCAHLPFLPRRPISGRVTIWAFLLGLGLVCPLTLLVSSLPLPNIAGGEIARQARFLDYVLHPGTLFLKAVILMPLLEEIFYRGLVMQLLRRYLRTWSAVMISTVFFGVTHLGQGAGTAVNAFALGLVFSALAIRTGSLLTSILCHSAFNLTWLFLAGPAFGITEGVLNPSAVSSSSASPYPLWWIGVSVSLVLAAPVMLTKFSPQRSIDG